MFKSSLWQAQPQPHVPQHLILSCWLIVLCVCMYVCGSDTVRMSSNFEWILERKNVARSKVIDYLNMPTYIHQHHHNQTRIDWSHIPLVDFKNKIVECFLCGYFTVYCYYCCSILFICYRTFTHAQFYWIRVF